MLVEFAIGNPQNEVSGRQRQILVAVLADADLAGGVLVALFIAVVGLQPTAVAGPPGPRVLVDQHMLHRTDEFGQGYIPTLRAVVHLTLLAPHPTHRDLLTVVTFELFVIDEAVHKEGEFVVFRTEVFCTVLETHPHDVGHVLALFEVFGEGLGGEDASA